MAFFIPWIAVGIGVGFIGWGFHQLVTKNDSADEVAKKVLSTLPDHVARHVESVSCSTNGLQFHFRPNTPKNIENEIRANIKNSNKPVSYDHIFTAFQII